MSQGLRIFAHRGVSSVAPENTVAAFAKCLEYGVEWFEFDVGISADASLVVLHDDTVQRTTNGTGAVAHMSFDQLRRLDAGAWFAPEYRFERIPELATVIDFMNTAKLAANLEIKPFEGPEETREALVEGIAQATKRLNRQGNLLVSSFQPSLLREFKELRPDVSLGYLVDGGGLRANFQGVLAEAAEIGCAAIHPDNEHLTDAQVAAMKEAGFTVNVWTVNTVERAQELRGWGVDGVFSDYPQVLVAAGLQNS